MCFNTISEKGFRYLDVNTMKNMLNDIDCSGGLNNIQLRTDSDNNVICVHDELFGSDYTHVEKNIIDSFDDNSQAQIDCLVAICMYAFSAEYIAE